MPSKCSPRTIRALSPHKKHRVVFILIPRMSGSTPPVDGATSTCALGEGSKTFVNQAIIFHLTTRHVSTDFSEQRVLERAVSRYSRTRNGFGDRNNGARGLCRGLPRRPAERRTSKGDHDTERGRRRDASTRGVCRGRADVLHLFGRQDRHDPEGKRAVALTPALKAALQKVRGQG